MSLWTVILAGGVGSRFWPISTPALPKQLLPLVTGEPMLRDAVDRLLPLVPGDRMLILTNATLQPAITAMLPEVPAGNIICEPRPAGTAAALAWAARIIEQRDPKAIMLSVHADWAIADPDGFRDALLRAANVAEANDALVTVGVTPTRPDPGFGYIEPGERMGQVAFRVARFLEKPDRVRARELIAHGCLWNSGIFVWRASRFLKEVEAHCPEVSRATQETTLEGFFAAVQSISVDVGVLERSDRVFVVPGAFGWDDVGTWAALRRVRPGDAAGNALHGDVTPVMSSGNVVHAESQSVVLYGVSDLVVVAVDGLTVVTTQEHAADLKTLIDALPARLKDRG
ncbi:MAG TPA: sugar phosphate nucleotidyltransferase [Gemmatimonadaceae bacterium]|nr:sugar phosphate nucleotidyltransferase [Gemmatimonadaceae bacterium]